MVTDRGLRLVLVGCLAVLLVALNACGPVISQEVRQQVPPDLAFKEVLADPDKYVGSMVVFSGLILQSVNIPQGTELMILQREADSSGRPQDTDQSGGRFLARQDGYLDVAIYATGRAVTVAGRVEGSEQRPLGQISYSYPVIRVEEIHLWRDRQPMGMGIGIFSDHFGIYHGW